MLPWVERPILDVDLDRPAASRFADMPRDALAAGQRLLGAVTESIPKKARVLAQAVRLRTLNRFHAEIVEIGRAHV